MLVMLEQQDDKLTQGAFLRAADLVDNLGQENNPDWKTIAINAQTQELISPNGSIGYRWGQHGKWNLEQRDGKNGAEVDVHLSLKITAMKFWMSPSPTLAAMNMNTIILNTLITVRFNYAKCPRAKCCSRTANLHG